MSEPGTTRESSPSALGMPGVCSTRPQCHFRLRPKKGQLCYEYELDRFRETHTETACREACKGVFVLSVFLSPQSTLGGSTAGRVQAARGPCALAGDQFTATTVHNCNSRAVASSIQTQTHPHLDFTRHTGTGRAEQVAGLTCL